MKKMKVIALMIIIVCIFSSMNVSGKTEFNQNSTVAVTETQEEREKLRKNITLEEKVQETEFDAFRIRYPGQGFVSDTKVAPQTTRGAEVITSVFSANDRTIDEVYGVETYSETFWIRATAGANMREEPKQDSEILETVARGTDVRAVGYTERWYKIEHNGKIGYVKKNLFTANETTEIGLVPKAENETKHISESEDTVDMPAFKVFYWGDSKERVTEIEGEPIISEKLEVYDSDYMIYNTTVAGLDTLLVYYFYNNELFTVKYILTEKHTTDAGYIDDYNKLVKGVTAKYGEPILDKEDWESDSRKEYYSGREGTALVFGYLEKRTYWIREDSIISITSSADNYEVVTALEYCSLSISPGEADYSSDF